LSIRSGEYDPFAQTVAIRGMYPDDLTLTSQPSVGIYITMATDIILAKLGFSMIDATIAEWLVPNGASVTEGQALYSQEAEKATQEIDVPASGILTILVPAGDAAAVGAVIGVIS